VRSVKTDKILKLLALTESSNENEAFLAFKVAKRLMRDNNIRWCDLEDPIETEAKHQYQSHQEKTDYSRYQYKEPERQPLDSEAAYKELKRLYTLNIEHKVEVVEVDKIKSLIKFFELRGHLTEKQCRLAYVLIRLNQHL
jgi:hypothetical protein